MKIFAPSILPVFSVCLTFLASCEKPAPTPTAAPTRPMADPAPQTAAPTTVPDATPPAAAPPSPAAPQPQPAGPSLTLDSPEIAEVLTAFSTLGTEMVDAVAGGERSKVMEVSRKGRELMAKSGQLQFRLPPADLKAWEEKLSEAKKPYLEAARQWSQKNAASTLQGLEGLRERARQLREKQATASEGGTPPPATEELTPGGPPKAVDTPGETPGNP